MSIWIISISLAAIACKLIFGTIKTRDVDRAKVYGEHLGKKLRD